VYFSTTLISVRLQSLGVEDMPKRRRVATLVVLPFAVATWLIGWCMCWTGEKKVARQSKNLRIK
jgi:hypothetical protein